LQVYTVQLSLCLYGRGGVVEKLHALQTVAPDGSRSGRSNTRDSPRHPLDWRPGGLQSWSERGRGVRRTPVGNWNWSSFNTVSHFPDWDTKKYLCEIWDSQGDVNVDLGSMFRLNFGIYRMIAKAIIILWSPVTHTFNPSWPQKPKVGVDWLELLHIRKVPGSNLSQEIDYSDVFLYFPQFLQENDGVVH
jgi:hypothetical protein